MNWGAAGFVIAGSAGAMYAIRASREARETRETRESRESRTRESMVLSHLKQFVERAEVPIAENHARSLGTVPRFTAEIEAKIAARVPMLAYNTVLAMHDPKDPDTAAFAKRLQIAKECGWTMD